MVFLCRFLLWCFFSTLAQKVLSIPVLVLQRYFLSSHLALNHGRYQSVPSYHSVMQGGRKGIGNFLFEGKRESVVNSFCMLKMNSQKIPLQVLLIFNIVSRRKFIRLASVSQKSQIFLLYLVSRQKLACFIAENVQSSYTSISFP